MSRFEILSGAPSFWRRLEGDLGEASSRVVVQAMTFEGDAAGRAVADAVAASPAQDRRVLVDAYTRFIVSDRFVYARANRADPVLRAEVRATTQMFEDLVAAGVGVRCTNPAGPAMVRFAARNHKKLVVLDDRVAYVGGVNFSDHNFAWHDLMVRIEDAEIAMHLRTDFDATWRGRPRASSASFSGAEIHALDGVTNGRRLRRLDRLVTTARRHVHVISPYLTHPFLDVLARCVRRGVTVTLVTPEANNKPVVRDNLLWRARTEGFDVQLLPGMTHLKALLVDDEALVVGSCNFDMMSHFAQDELIAVLHDADVIADFRRVILDPALAGARPMDFEVPTRRGRRCRQLLKLGEWGARLSLAFAGRAPRRVTRW